MEMSATAKSLASTRITSYNVCYTKLLRLIDHEYLDNMCEIPLAIASCPTGALKPGKTELADGKKVNTILVNNERCMYCGNCYTMCPGMPVADPVGDGVSIWVGGKISSARTPPKFSRLVIPRNNFV